MNITEIKERCERGKFLNDAKNDELDGLSFDEWWGPEELLNIHVEQLKADVPQMLAWIEQITEVVEQLIPHADKAMTHHPFICHCPVCRAQRLLAEVTR